MSEVKSREVVVAIRESFGLEVTEKNPEGMITGRVRVVEGPTAGREEVLYLRLKGGAAEISLKQLRALGWAGNDITALHEDEGLGSVTADMTGKDDEYNGKVRRSYSIWARRTRPTLRTEDQKAFAAKFKAMAAGLKDNIVTPSDANRAPATLPEAKASNGATPATESDAAVSDPRSMFA